MFKIKNWFIKSEPEALVKTLRVVSQHGAIYYIHLFESASGKRRATYFCNGETYDIDKRNAWLKSSDVFQEQVYRWLSGRYDPNIPKYDDIPGEDIVAALKGTI